MSALHPWGGCHMKKGILLASLLLAGAAQSQSMVGGYTRSDGTYVAPHYRSAPDSTVTNNFGYQGNTNPYTGQTGQQRYSHDLTSPYYSGPNNSGQSGHSQNYGYGSPYTYGH